MEYTNHGPQKHQPRNKKNSDGNKADKTCHRTDLAGSDFRNFRETVFALVSMGFLESTIGEIQKPYSKMACTHNLSVIGV